MRQIGLIILLFFTSLAYAQNVEFKASAPSVVAVGEQFKLEYTLNKEGDNLKVPTLEGFDLLMGPSVGQSFYSSNINGKMTQNVTFSYTYILEGTKKAEFAIIVISQNFFDREWTEKELVAFLNRQNRNGQKLILPILHNITITQLQEKYPSVADIQAIDSSKYSCDEIALLFARQLIKRLKAV